MTMQDDSEKREKEEELELETVDGQRVATPKEQDRTHSIKSTSTTPSTVVEGQALETSNTGGERPSTAGSTHDPDFPPAKRVRTAPAEGSRRPRLLTRTSTLLGNLTRTGTGDQLLGAPRGTYSYTFDPLSSDSDSSSSSDDERFPMPAWRKKRRQSRASQEQKQQQKPVASVKRDAEEKKEAKDGHSYSRFAIKNEFFRTKGKVSKKDGRLRISVNETTNRGYIAKALGQSIKNHLEMPKQGRKRSLQPTTADEKKRGKGDGDAVNDAKAVASDLTGRYGRPKLNILVMIIGSRGDIQPFIKIGKVLKNDYGHRVRIASHPTFREFVEKDAGLEFFSVGGDPSELMAFMVKNPGLIPNVQTVVEGEIQRRRAGMAEMFEGFWRAAINTTDDERDIANLKLMGNKEPFVADAIIANPPSMAHVHIAEKLGIPLHMMFTFPYSPTTQFPHPLANIRGKKTNVDPSHVNFMSYPLVEMMTWQGLGDIVNRFRENTLRLEPVSSLWAPGALYRMKVPYTYMWSPSLVPKPADWGPEIDIGGFVFLELASNFKPPQDLTDFLNAGEAPVYIGFGSIVVDDPDAFTQMIFKAVELAGVRALVNKGWGGLGKTSSDAPKSVFMLDNTPHDWLFPKVKAVVHHGGAGTTAIGLKCGKPTMIVPFFGDQPFWGAMVASAKAGAHECIPYKKLTAEKLAEGIKRCLTEEAQQNVQRIADSISREGDGAENAVQSFHRSLPLAGKHNMRCSILPERVAVWQLRQSSLRMSALAAEILHRKGKFKWSELKLLRHYEWNDFDGPGDPFTGGVGAVTSSLYDIGENFGMVPVRIARHMREREEHARKKRERQQRKEERKAAKSSTNDRNVLSKEDPANKNGSDDRPLVTRAATNNTQTSMISSEPPEPLPREVIDDVAGGLGRSAAALLTLPNDLHVAIAQGFHNAPRLYGDATVRKPIRIVGVRSGFRAAGREFVFGIYDGFTGLITQPVDGWHDADTARGKFFGLGTGFGKGVGGLVLKNINAVVAPPAFIGKGVIQYISKRNESPGSKDFIRRAHMIQGQKELAALTKHQPSSPEDTKPASSSLRNITERTKHAWRVYEELWATAAATSESFGPFRLRREKRRWDANGALETAGTAEQALHAHRRGRGDLDALLAKRKLEVEEASQPRELIVENTADDSDGLDVAGETTVGGGQHHLSLSSSSDEKEQDENKLSSDSVTDPRDKIDEVDHQQQQHEENSRDRLESVGAKLNARAVAVVAAAG